MIRRAWGEHHQALHQERREPQRPGRLPLAPGNGQDAAPHHLGDEGSGIDHQRQQQGGEFRGQHEAALEVEPGQLGPLQHQGRARGEDRGRQTARRQQAQGNQARPGCPAFLQPLAQEDPVRRRRCHQGQPQDGHRRGEARTGPRGRQHQPPVHQEHGPGKGQGLARRREGVDDGTVPEEELQQEGRVAGHLHVQGGQEPHQPVGGQASQPRHHPHRRRQDDPQHGHPQGVDQAGQESAAVGVRRLVGDRAFPDGKGGGMAQEVEAGRDAQLLQVALDVAEKVGTRCYRNQHHGQLKEQPPQADVTHPGPHPSGGPCRHKPPSS